MFFPGETDLEASGRHIVPSLSGFLAYSHLSCSAKPLFIWLKFLEGTRNPWEKFALYIPLILRGLAYKHGIRVLIDEYTSSCLKQAVPLVLFCLKKGRDIHWVQCFPGVKHDCSESGRPQVRRRLSSSSYQDDGLLPVQQSPPRKRILITNTVHSMNQLTT